MVRRLLVGEEEDIDHCWEKRREVLRYESFPDRLHGVPISSWLPTHTQARPWYGVELQSYRPYHSSVISTRPIVTQKSDIYAELKLGSFTVHARDV